MGNDGHEWSERRKWWLDLVKSIVVFVIVAVATSTIIENINTKIVLKRFQLTYELQRHQRIVDDFERGSKEYLGDAYDVA